MLDPKDLKTWKFLDSSWLWNSRKNDDGLSCCVHQQSTWIPHLNEPPWDAFWVLLLLPFSFRMMNKMKKSVKWDNNSNKIRPKWTSRSFISWTSKNEQRLMNQTERSSPSVFHLKKSFCYAPPIFLFVKLLIDVGPQNSESFTQHKAYTHDEPQRRSFPPFFIRLWTRRWCSFSFSLLWGSLYFVLLKPYSCTMK